MDPVSERLIKALHHEDSWRPLPPFPWTSTPGNRSATDLGKVLDQLCVGTAPRYRARDNKTFCNIYAWDVASACGVDLPHWVDGLLTPCAPGKGRETNANTLCDLLSKGALGWRACLEGEAVGLARAGHPVVAVWRNDAGPGHIAVVEPDSTVGAILYAQAGAVNGRRLPHRRCFSSDKVVHYFWHE